MSKVIDAIAILGAIGVTGYFVYRLVLPQLSNIKFPSFSPPQISFLPSSQPQYSAPPPPVTQSQEPSRSSNEEDDDEAPTTTTSSKSQPSSSITPPPPNGQVLYDSSKGWTGVTTAASGSPKWSASGGVGRLSCGAGHCRVYIAVPNHNARMEGEFMFESGSVDNISLRLRSRHQEGGACENRFGGFGTAIHPDGEVEFQTESCHNNHENSISGKVPPIAQKTWHKFAYSCYDSPDKKSVNFKLELDGKTVLTGKHPSPKPYFMDEALHKKKSYIWIRSNNSGQGVIAVRNFRVINIATASQQSLLLEPYIYNSYYNRRRL